MDDFNNLKDLQSLPAPTVIEALSLEAIFQELLADFQKRYPEYSAILESDPAMKLLEVAAYRELLLRNRINAAARANLLAFAAGTDLDHLAAFYGVERLQDELDTMLRTRVRQRIIGFANAGGAAHYRYWAMSASHEVADVEVDSPEPGVVRISVLGKVEYTDPGETVSEQALQAVRDVVLSDKIRVLTDTVEVIAAELIPVEVHARIWLYPDTPIEAVDTITDAFPQVFADNAGLGWDLTLSWIISELHKEGVHKVELMEPVMNTAVLPYQAVRLMDFSLEYVGRDR